MLSLSLHLLLLGTGVAFARLAGDLLRGRHEPIMVDLIGGQGTTAAGSEAETAAPRLTRRNESRPSKTAEQERVPVEQEAPAQDAALVPQPDSRQPGGGAADVQHALQEGADTAGEPAVNGSASAGSQSGSFSSEQWAVIVSSIERVKTYPRLARERGIEGVVRLRFKVKPRGDVDRVEIVNSSGSDILDTASVRTLYRAGPLPYVNGWVEVPIAYILK